MIFLDYDPLYQALWSASVLLSFLLLAWAWRRRGIRAGLAFPMARFKGYGIRKNWRAKIAHAPFLLRMASVGCVLIALARPQVPQEETAEVEGIDIVVAFDLSGSMVSVDISDEKLIELQNEGKEKI